ncbi:hypothetical protein ACFQGT_00730 [Natrialbaceae archaeon GCM10025810]|uniref:hypothetical protein n=1 Tax=Halovalidus salilacus TaxID=3075124 RepID=UPI00360F1E74
MSDRTADTNGVVLAARSAGLIAGIGALILASTIVTTITGTMGIHNVVVGAVIAVAASAYVYWIDGSASVVAAAVLGALGLWVVASPFVLGVSRTLTIVVNAVLGGLIVLLSLVGIYAAVRGGSSDRSPGRRGTAAEE